MTRDAERDWVGDSRVDQSCYPHTSPGTDDNIQEWGIYSLLKAKGKGQVNNSLNSTVHEGSRSRKEEVKNLSAWLCVRSAESFVISAAL